MKTVKKVDFGSEVCCEKENVEETVNIYEEEEIEEELKKEAEESIEEEVVEKETVEKKK